MNDFRNEDWPMIQNLADGSQAKRSTPCEFWQRTKPATTALTPEEWCLADHFCTTQNRHLTLAVRLARRDQAAGEQGRAAS